MKTYLPVISGGFAPLLGQDLGEAVLTCHALSPELIFQTPTLLLTEPEKRV